MGGGKKTIQVERRPGWRTDSIILESAGWTRTIVSQRLAQKKEKAQRSASGEDRLPRDMEERASKTTSVCHVEKKERWTLRRRNQNKESRRKICNTSKFTNLGTNTIRKETT